MITRINAAAILHQGIIMTLPPPARHGTIIAAMTQALGEVDIPPRAQGFLTSDGRYVGRREAAQIAYFARQIGTQVDELYSEDIF
jgi:hypothetical protein